MEEKRIYWRLLNIKGYSSVFSSTWITNYWGFRKYFWLSEKEYTNTHPVLPQASAITTVRGGPLIWPYTAVLTGCLSLDVYFKHTVRWCFKSKIMHHRLLDLGLLNLRWLLLDSKLRRQSLVSQPPVSYVGQQLNQQEPCPSQWEAPWAYGTLNSIAAQLASVPPGSDPTLPRTGQF